jgi:hypothetical protein
VFQVSNNQNCEAISLAFMLPTSTHNSQPVMCDERLSRLREIVHSIVTRVPVVIVQRAEEIYPALKESMVSVLCLCAQKGILLFCLQIYVVKINFVLYGHHASVFTFTLCPLGKNGCTH